MSLVDTVPNMLGRYGRAMTVRRRQGTTTTFTQVSVTGILRSFRPEEIAGGVMQGDAQAIITANEIIGTAGFSPPVKGDFVAIDGKNWAVLGVTPRMIESDVVAYHLWMRGGA